MADCRLASSNSLLLMISNKDSLFLDRTCSLDSFASAAKLTVSAPVLVKTASPGFADSASSSLIPSAEVSDVACDASATSSDASVSVKISSLLLSSSEISYSSFTSFLLAVSFVSFFKPVLL